MVDARFVRTLSWLRFVVVVLGVPAVALSGCDQ